MYGWGPSLFIWNYHNIVNCHTPIQNTKFKVWRKNKQTNKQKPSSKSKHEQDFSWPLRPASPARSSQLHTETWHLATKTTCSLSWAGLTQPKTLSCFLCLASTIHPRFFCRLPPDLPRPVSHMSSMLLSLHRFTSWSIKIRPFEFWFSLVQ